jgi:hypothetical protein
MPSEPSIPELSLVSARMDGLDLADDVSLLIVTAVGVLCGML